MGLGKFRYATAHFSTSHQTSITFPYATECSLAILMELSQSSVVPYATPHRSGMEIFFAFIIKPRCQQPLASSSKAGQVFFKLFSKVSQLQDSKQVGRRDLFCIYHQTNIHHQTNAYSLKLISQVLVCVSFWHTEFEGIPHISQIQCHKQEM